MGLYMGCMGLDMGYIWYIWVIYIYVQYMCVYIYIYIYTSVNMCVNKDICKLDIVHGL